MGGGRDGEGIISDGVDVVESGGEDVGADLAARFRQIPEPADGEIVGKVKARVDAGIFFEGPPRRLMTHAGESVDVVGLAQFIAAFQGAQLPFFQVRKSEVGKHAAQPFQPLGVGGLAEEAPEIAVSLRQKVPEDLRRGLTAVGKNVA